MTRGRGDRARSYAERVYAVMLVAYPKEFRREYGECMIQAFGDQYRDEARRGRTRLWGRTLVDVVTTAVVERWRGVREEGIVRHYRLAGGVGFVLLIAPLFFVAASLLKYGLGIGFLFEPLERAFYSDPQVLDAFNKISPIVFFGGLGAALALNARTMLRVGVSREEGALVGTVRLEPRILNAAVVLVSASLLVTLLCYVLLENFALR